MSKKNTLTAHIAMELAKQSSKEANKIEINIEMLEAMHSFADSVAEIAFGDDAMKRGYCYDEVLEKLREYSDQALQYDELFNITYRQYSSIDDFERAKKEFAEENY